MTCPRRTELANRGRLEMMPQSKKLASTFCITSKIWCELRYPVGPVQLHLLLHDGVRCLSISCSGSEAHTAGPFHSHHNAAVRSVLEAVYAGPCADFMFSHHCLECPITSRLHLYLNTHANARLHALSHIQSHANSLSNSRTQLLSFDQVERKAAYCTVASFLA
jgi:hypothetical protein